MDSLETQLINAVRGSKMDVVQSLLDKGCKVNIGDADNMTPLHVAAMKDHQRIAKLLMEKGAKVNTRTTDKMAPLHFAAVRGFAEMVTLLIRGGAAVDPLDSNDRTPLMLAVSRGHIDVVEILIQSRASVNIEEIHGYTPLCEAVWSKSVEMAAVLLGAGAKQTQSQYLLHYTVLHRHLPMAELLLRHGAYPNLRDDHGDTPLIKAAYCCHLDMVKLLLRYEANPNGTSSVTNFTPLHKALLRPKLNEAHFEELVQTLCLYDVNLDVSTSTASTPLVHAMMQGHMHCAATLVRAGADVNKPNETPFRYFLQPQYLLDLALVNEMYTLVYLIVAAGYNMKIYKADFPSDFSKVDTETCKGWLTYMKFNPRRLVDLCRIEVRRQMGSKVLLLVPTLDIPQSLKKFLLFKEFYI